jgi:hypothetical protein
MPHTKKSKLTNDVANTATMPSRRSSTSIAGHINASLNDLSADGLANILGCLGPDEIMRMRRVCHKWSEAVKKTTVPLTKFRVNDAKSYNAMIAMTTALPNLQQIALGSFTYDFSNRISHRYLHGEDPDEEKARGSAANDVVHELDAISSFTKLRILDLSSTPLNGKYPCLFNFPLLQKLTVFHCPHLKWDLDMLAGFPLLRELNFTHNGMLTGNIKSLRVLKDTLEKVEIIACSQVGGSFMEFADFPRLKSLILRQVDSITGDIRDIGENDFSKLEVLHLPESVYGGDRYKIMRSSDAKELIATIYSLKKQRHRHPSLFEKFNWYLSESSPDWYREAFGYPMAYPFSFCIVRAGSRLGWRWERKFDYTPDYHFEVNWLDPLPDKKSSEYGSYIQALQDIESDMNKYAFFRGYHEPPTEAVYKRLERQYRPSREEMEIMENL